MYIFERVTDRDIGFLENFHPLIHSLNGYNTEYRVNAKVKSLKFYSGLSRECKGAQLISPMHQQVSIQTAEQPQLEPVLWYAVSESASQLVA